jgi:hypothetical protein
MTTDIKERLRGDIWASEVPKIVEEAADRIEELEANNATLRAAALAAKAAERERLEPWLRHQDDCQSHIVSVRGEPDECTCCLAAAIRNEDT